MKSKNNSAKITRREFINISGAAGLSLLLSSCRLNQVEAALKPTQAATSIPAITLSPSQQQLASTTLEADLIILNAKVITLDALDSIAQAIAVKDGLIVAVGNNEQLKALTGKNTKVIDAAKKVVTPGLIDAHIHYAVAGLLNTYYIPFIAPTVTDIPSLQAELVRVLASKPKGEWLVGFFFALKGDGLPDRYELDKASPAHPVWLMQQGGHVGVANSLALKLSAVTAQTPNPSGGIIERDAKGELTGVFYNHRSMDVLRRTIPRYTEDLVLEGMEMLQTSFLAAGVTSFQDNNVRDTSNLKTYRQLAEQGKLQMRNAVYYTLEWEKDLETALKIEAFDLPLSRFAGYKFLIDGTAPTAFCHEKHSGASWNLSTWEAKSFKDTIRILHDTGKQICVHCYGDAAADLTLDAYEAAMNANPRSDPRHRIEHAVITTQQATQRCKDLGVVIQYNPTFIHLAGDYWPKQFSPAQVSRIIVSREWLENGVHTTIGSDFPSTPWLKPQATIAAAMWRESPLKKPVRPEQSLTFMEALKAHTLGAAYAAHEEKLKGSIEPGKLADLAMWSRDPTSADPKAIYNFPDMSLTIIGGKIVHQA